MQKAKSEVSGFSAIYQRLEQKVALGGLSDSTPNNYGPCIARISLYLIQPAIALDEEQIMGIYMHWSWVNNPPITTLSIQFMVYDFSLEVMRWMRKKSDLQV